MTRRPRRRTPSFVNRSVSLNLTLDVGVRYLWLSVLWLVLCVPVVTALASTSAMLATVEEWKEGDERPVASQFFTALRRFLRVGVLTQLLVLAVATLFVVNITISNGMGASGAIVLAGIIGVAIPVALIATVLPFSILRGQGTVAATLRDAAVMAFTMPRLAIGAPILIAVNLGLCALTLLAPLVFASPTARVLWWLHDRDAARRARSTAILLTPSERKSTP